MYRYSVFGLGTVLRCLWLLVLLACGAQSLLVERYGELPRREYDFVIVGGGTAGSVLAHRLTENPQVSVLVLEAGVTHKGAFRTQVPFYAPTLTGSQYDWGYSTTPQAALGGRVIPYPRGFVLGGSSTINLLVYTRTSAEDYNRYAAVTGDKGWSWDSLQVYFRKNERFVPPVDHHNTAGQFDPRVHSKTGVTSVSLPGFPRGSDPFVIKASAQLKEFPYTLDMNSGNTLGIGWTQSTINNGTRSSAATSYLADQYLNRPNLHILLNARVTRLLQTASTAKGPVFRGVEVTQDAGVSFHTFFAKKEVLLSAGAVNSPAILMHSGIGDTATLKSLGIAPIIHLPSVGQNLTEHPRSGAVWQVNSTDTFEAFSRDPVAMTALESRWNTSHTGPFSAGRSSQLGFFRIPHTNPMFKNVTDPASGKTTPHYELLFANGNTIGSTPADGNYFSIAFAAVQPTSRGSITITSSDPLAPPAIDPNLLATEFDVATLREAYLAIQRFLKAPVFEKYVIRQLVDIPNTAEAIDAYIKSTAGVVWHPCGTAMMTAKGAGYGVVNPDLNVKGAVGLRVIDASVFPFIPAGHTQAPVYVFAERASDLIKLAWGL